MAAVWTYDATTNQKCAITGGGIFERVHDLDGTCGGDTVPSFGAVNWASNKYKYKNTFWPYTAADGYLKRNYQPKTGSRNGGKYGGEVQRAGHVGEAQYRHFGGVVSWITGINNNKIVEFNSYFFLGRFVLYLKPSHTALGQPLPQRLPGWGGWKWKKPCRWTGNQLHHGGVLCWMVWLLSTICLYYSYVANAMVW